MIFLEGRRHINAYNYHHAFPYMPLYINQRKWLQKTHMQIYTQTDRQTHTYTQSRVIRRLRKMATQACLLGPMGKGRN